MRKLMLISAACSVLGYAAVHFVFFSKPRPEPEPPVAAQPAQPAEPVVLATVVDVTDLDALLDPRPGEPVGVPFDPTEPLEPATRVNATPAPIPPATD
jgi:hypothetical protein